MAESKRLHTLTRPKRDAPHPLVTLSSMKFEDVTVVPIFILTPLTYLGGVFYLIKRQRGWGQAATHGVSIGMKKPGIA